MATENSNEIWADDKLARRDDADFLIAFLVGRIGELAKRERPSCFVLNIDAGWGQGKTFFLDRLRRELEARDIAVACINAWRDDHADDPLLPVMAEIETAITPLIARDKVVESSIKALKRAATSIVVAGGKGALKQLGRKMFGEAAEVIGQNLEIAKEVIASAPKDDIGAAMDKIIDKKGDELLADFKESQKSIAEFRKELQKITARLNDRDGEFILFILIDELDRCRPDYAVSLLERIKHLFDIDRIVFVIATDTEQLSHSVSAIYGQEFNGKKYLGRFFDRTFSFPPLLGRSFIEKCITDRSINSDKLSTPNDVALDDFLAGAFSCFNLNLRDIEKSIDLLSTISTLWNRKAKIELGILIPLVAAYQSGRITAKDNSVYDGLGIKKLFDNGDYIMKFTDLRDRMTGLTRVNVSLSDPAQHIWTTGIDLTKLNRDDPSGALSNWTYFRLSEEFALEHQNSFQPGTRLQSLVRKYPELIMSAGRLRGTSLIGT